ncbi:MAG TPA: TRCF domain-containing protein, partial [Rhodothermales bacterium]|nr:TRCF domain-containing protein [Rhodothermales bacterium]
PPRAAETSLDVEEDALIPAEYVGNNVERLNLYRRIAEADGPKPLEELRVELRDRFGPVPDPVEHLLIGAEMRLLAQRLRLARVQFKNERLWLDTPEPEADAYFYDTLFQPFLNRLETLGRRYVLKETGRKLRVIVQDVRTLEVARDVLARLVPEADASSVPA